MIDIVRELHGLVPIVLQNGKEVFDRVPVVGDQKTMERGVETQFSIRNAYSKHRDWRACSFNFLIGIMKTSSYQ